MGNTIQKNKHYSEFKRLVERCCGPINIRDSWDRFMVDTYFNYYCKLSIDNEDDDDLFKIFMLIYSNCFADIETAARKQMVASSFIDNCRAIMTEDILGYSVVLPIINKNKIRYFEERDSKSIINLIQNQ